MASAVLSPLAEQGHGMRLHEKAVVTVQARTGHSFQFSWSVFKHW